ncbi:hypothetical protein INR49_010199 [Caranx melampygus]|nr:hypothetical protein INR49_010199 [Caranx melampygus]
MYPSAVTVCGHSSLVPVLVLVLVLVCPAAGYNLDQDHSLEFSGAPSSMFGYSVLLHRHRTHNWLVVGAPIDNSTADPWIQSPGAVYRCNINAVSRRCHQMPTDVPYCGKTCEAESDHQWLGACAHRWKNVFYSKKDSQNHKLPLGICYRYDNDLSYSRHLSPCYSDHQRKFGEGYGSCQAGISNFQTEDLKIMGTPGTSYWLGSIVVFDSSKNRMSVYATEEESGPVSFGSYLGYSVGAGHFLSPETTEVVGGAPQHNQRGKVLIFTVDETLLHVVSEVSGKELGSYFGSSLCAVDLNADGLSDLLVGAPMTTGVTREEGRVHVYINQGEARMLEAEFQLTGSDAYAARFGETIADLGDLDDDGYHDVAIGAPQEDDLKGAVYIYNGRKEGISPAPSQRITGSTLGHKLMMFGQSLSSGVDIDDNGYQDVAVGAFLSDSAVVLRTRPVIQVKASLSLPEQIDQRLALCEEHKTPTVCLNVTVCFSVKSRRYTGAIELQYNLTSDVLHKASFPHRFYFHGNGSSNSTKGRVRVRQGHLTCTTHVAYQRKDVRDIFTPVQFEVSYGLRETKSHRASLKSFPPLKPILQQRAGHQNVITNQTWFARSCSLVNCSTNMQLSAQLVLPHQQEYFALGSGQTITLKTSLLNSGDDAFLPRLTLQFPNNIHYIKVLQNLNISFLLDVNQNSTPANISIHVSTGSDNYEREEYLHDNVQSLLLPLKYGVNINIHGRLMFCGRGDKLCERLVCRLGNLEAGRDATIQLETRVNPAVLLQAPAGFFKRDLKKKEEEFRRHSWDYVPKSSNRESFS